MSYSEVLECGQWVTKVVSFVGFRWDPLNCWNSASEDQARARFDDAVEAFERREMNDEGREAALMELRL